VGGGRWMGVAGRGCGGGGVKLVLMLHYWRPSDALGFTHSAGRRSCQSHYSISVASSSIYNILYPLAHALLAHLHAAAETEDEVESGLLLNVVVRESAAVLQLLPREDEALLVGGDALLVLRGVRG